MIVLKLMDGLGNQMFQYAFARYLQTVYHEPIVFETMRLGKGAVRKFGLDKLDIPLVDGKAGINTCRMAGKVENRILFFSSKIIREFFEKMTDIPMTGEKAYWKMIQYGFYTTKDATAFYEFKKSKMPVKFVRGYFQSENYFIEIKEIIKKELLVKDVERLKELANKLRNEESVCIHIRRGDYIGSRRFEVCTEEYYRKAVDYMVNELDNPKFYVFSNTAQDLQWIKQNYTFLNKAHLTVEGEDEYGDLYLMYNCKHHIISNSTFSWWGSYLSDNEDGITIAPKRWVNADEQQDIILNQWITL